MVEFPTNLLKPLPPDTIIGLPVSRLAAPAILASAGAPIVVHRNQAPPELRLEVMRRSEISANLEGGPEQSSNTSNRGGISHGTGNQKLREL